MIKPKITCFGEVLWDIFPSQENIGGAPLNVALRLQSFGNDVSMISCVGDDEKGNTLLEYMNQNGLNSMNVQIHDKLQTGKVMVSLNDKGSATYEIQYSSAWDSIELTDEALSLAKQSDAFVFGSLVA